MRGEEALSKLRVRTPRKKKKRKKERVTEARSESCKKCLKVGIEFGALKMKGKV